MDQIDEKILTILQDDGRISMQKLAKMLPMSVPATCERVHRLEDAGVITGYTAKINPVEMGKTVNAFILFSVNIGRNDEFLNWAKKEPRIISAYFLAGRFTVMLNVSCKDMMDYASLIQELYPRGTSETYIKIQEVKPGAYMF